MTDRLRPGEPERDFFAGAGPALPEDPPRPPRRPSPLLRRAPFFAAVALAVSAWLLVGFWPDVAYYFSSRTPIDLGGPGAYRLDAARPNRLVQIRGELVDGIPVTVGRSGAARTVGWLAGTTLVVDRPGRGGPPVFEGRLLPASARGDYAEVIAALRARGAALPEGVAVLRDGERPRSRLAPVLGSLVLVALALVNLRALALALLPRSDPRRPR